MGDEVVAVAAVEVRKTQIGPAWSGCVSKRRDCAWEEYLRLVDKIADGLFLMQVAALAIEVDEAAVAVVVEVRNMPVPVGGAVWRILATKIDTDSASRQAAALAIAVDEVAAVEVVVVLPEVDEALLEDEVLPEVAVEVLEAPRVVRGSSS